MCVLLVALPLLLVRIAVVGLVDPSEARYAQIASEMVASGDWISPRYHGVPHLEKPPLAYWSAAAGLRLLGHSEFAARAGAALAVLASAALAAGIANRYGGAAAAAAAAAAVVLSPYTVMAGAACLTEPFLLLASALFLHAVVRRESGAGPRSMTVAALAIALGLLAKGYVVLLFTVLPLAITRPRLLLELVRPHRVVLMLGLVAPWFAAAELRHPGFLSEHVFRLQGHVAGRGHRAPFFTYVAVLWLGMFPFAIFALSGWRRLRGDARRLLGPWLLVPLAILTIVPSRSWTYALPLVVPLAVLAGNGVALAAARRSFRLPVFAALSGAVLLVTPLVWPRLGSGQADLLRVLGVAALAAAAWTAWSRDRQRWVGGAGIAMLLSAAMTVAAIRNEPLFKINRRLAHAASSLATRGQRIYVAGSKLPSVSFYHRGDVVVVGVGGRVAHEAKVWGESDRYLPDVDAGDFVLAHPQAVIVLGEGLRAQVAPQRPALRRSGAYCLIGPESGSNPGRP